MVMSPRLVVKMTPLAEAPSTPPELPADAWGAGAELELFEELDLKTLLSLSMVLCEIWVLVRIRGLESID